MAQIEKHFGIASVSRFPYFNLTGLIRSPMLKAGSGESKFWFSERGSQISDGIQIRT
jgi:hypothetical protein